MPETDYVLMDVIDKVAPEYHYCLQKTQELFSDLIKDESVMQSASATIWINATKEKSTVAELSNRLKTRIAKLNEEAIPSAIQVWEWHFRDFIKEFGPRIKGQIAYYVSQNAPADVIEQNIKERVYHLRCEKLDTIEEQNALAKEMFGED